LNNVFIADYETTTKAEDCRVWLWGLYDIYGDKFNYNTTIESFFDYLQTLPNKSKLYFHNLKFDGEFLFYHLFRNGFVHSQSRSLNDYEFSTLITNMGVFYAIHVKLPSKEFTFYDSLKIIPLPVNKISKSFNIAQKKGDIDYIKERPIGYIPDNEEVEYVKNDVEIVGKALLYFFDQGLNKMTQASNAFADYKKIIGAKKFERLFPSLDCIHEELKQSYKGGFTYASPRYQGKLVGKGLVLDVNSLYPSVMYYSYLPYGEPILYEGKYKPDKLYNLYIQMFRCNFELKEGFLPTIQLKHNAGFQPTEYVTSSEGLDVTLCLTNIDLELFFKHYDVYNIEWFNGWKFKSTNTLFKDYIDKWIKVKDQATIDGNEGMRTLAKFMLNMLYGKFGLNPKVRSKIPTFDGEMIHYTLGGEGERDSIYIPVASFVTSYARKTTIESGQKNFDRFMYADTDSLHLDGEETPKDINIDSVKMGYWKHEGNFNKARFLRAKSYIENMYIPFSEWDKLKDEKKKKWTWNFTSGVFEQIHVACAGLPTSCHDRITFDNFKNGMVIGGKLQHKRVKGGVVLKEIDFSIQI
jgi:hypothetical protein